MTVLPTGLDTTGPEYAANRAALLTKLDDLATEHAKALAGAARSTWSATGRAGSCPPGSGSSC